MHVNNLSLSPSPFGSGPYIKYRNAWLNELHPIHGNWHLDEENANGNWHQFNGNSVPVRKNLSTLGQPINVEVNYFQALFQPGPNLKVHQYDVKMYFHKDLNKEPKSEADISRKVKEKVWNSQAIRQALGRYSIYNGDKIAW
jgi:hypothetical protein